MFMSKPLNPEQQLLPDTSDHSSGVDSLLATNGLFIPLITIVTALRIYTKFFTARNLFLDDYLMIAAAISFLVFASVNIAGVAIGFGLHGWDLPGTTLAERLGAAERVLEYNFVSLVFLSPAICLSKLSIVATLLRIFTWQASPRLLRHVLLATSLVVTVCCGSQLVFTIFQCSRVPLSWELLDPAESGSCGNLETAVLAAGVMNVVTDFVICCSPIPVFMKLQLPLRQRLCVSALFLSGLITSLFALLRVFSSRGLENNPDATFVVVPYFNYSVAEAGLCIITGSIPALRPLLATILPSFVETYNLENLVVSAKENIRRAASRQSSRQRRPSDPTAPDSPRQSTEDKDEASRDNTTESSPHILVAGCWKQSHVALLLGRAAKHAVTSLVARLRGPSREERTRGRQPGRGRRRPLSVINELDEVCGAAEDAQDRGLGIWSRVKDLFEGQKVSCALADARRRFAGVGLRRQVGGATGGDGGGGGGQGANKPMGSIIVIREIEVTESRRPRKEEV